MPQAKVLFHITIGETDTGLVAKIVSLTEGKKTTIEAFNMRLLMREIDKLVKKRRSFLRRFPVRSIITVEEGIAERVLRNGG